MQGRIADASLADFGRKELTLAEHEMPGLMAIRRKYGPEQPLAGARISGSLHMTIQTAALIETLEALGAKVRWCSCNVFSTQDHAAAAIYAKGTAAVFAWKGETQDEYWWCTQQALDWGEGKGPDLIVDDGGDMTLMIHEGVKAEEEYERTGSFPPIPENASPDELAMVQRLREEIQKDPKTYRRMAKGIVGVSEETTTGVHRFQEMAKRGELLFPAFNVNDCVTKSKFDNIYGCRHSLPDGLMRATDVLIGGKKVLVCGFGDVGKGCSQAMKGCGARVFVTEIDPICALQACMEGFEVVRMEDVVEEIDIFVTATGNRDIITAEHMLRMKNNAIVCNIGHFDNEIQVGKIRELAKTVVEIKPQVHRFVLPRPGCEDHGILILAEGRLMNLGCATGHPSFVMSCSFSNQTLAQVELWKERNSCKYGPSAVGAQVFLLPKHLDEMVARLHLDHFNAHLTTLTETQSKYSNIPVQGPYKSDLYRY